MRKINYSLIISDFDGTLVCENGTIGDKNKTTIAQYVKDGGNFAISTGRLHYGILPRAQELGLTGAISCCQGALIMDLATGKPLLNGTFTNEQTIEMCRQMEALGLHIHLYDFDEYYVNMDDEALKIYEGLTHKKGTIITDKPLSQLAKEKGLFVVDGIPLTPHISDFFADEILHPNDLGFGFYAENLLKVLKEKNLLPQ